MINIEVNAICDALEMVNEDSEAFLNLDTGEILWLDEYFDRDEYEKNLEEIECGNFARLPSKYEINEYEMMCDFVSGISLNSIHTELERTIHGKAAFRRFKDKIRCLGIENDWYEFRDNAYRKTAEEWIEKVMKEIR